jgi:hypothetical protein
MQEKVYIDDSKQTLLQYATALITSMVRRAADATN